MANSVPFFSKVEDFLASYLLCIRQAIFVYLHCFDGIHRFDDPVSKTTLKLCGGVPIEIAPKYCAYRNQIINLPK